MKFSKYEIDWLDQNFPQLKYNGTIIKGILSFSASYDEQKKKIIFDPTENNQNALRSKYKIKIAFPSKNDFKVFDVDNVIKTSAKKKRILKDYIHINLDQSMCITAPKRWKELKEEVESSENKIKKIITLIAQFLYHQTYVLKFRKEPWKGFAHGKRGINEEQIERHQKDFKKQIEKSRNYYDEHIPIEIKEIIQKGKIDRNVQCPCGSGKKYKRCHLHQVEMHLISAGGRRTINLFLKER